MYFPTVGIDQAVLRWWSRWVFAGRKARARYDGAEDCWTLAYTARYRLTVALIFVLFTALYAVAYFGRIVPLAGVTDFLLLVGSICIWSLATGIFISSWIERVTITSQGLRRRSWHGREQIAWLSLASIGVSLETHTVTLVSTDRTALRVSLYLDGLASLRDALVEHAGMMRTPASAMAFPAAEAR